jgi:hypothetical protein
VNSAIIYYNATGNVHALAQAAAEGAEKVGVRVRLRKVAELVPPEAISANPAQGRHLRGLRTTGRYPHKPSSNGRRTAGPDSRDLFAPPPTAPAGNASGPSGPTMEPTQGCGK